MSNSNLRDSYGPEATPYQRVHPQPLEYVSQVVAKPHETTEIEPSQDQSTHGKKRKILGLAPVHFALVTALLLVVLGAGIGVGVGIGMKKTNDNHDSSSSGDTSNGASTFSSVPAITTPTPPSTLSSTTTKTTTSTPAPIATSGTHGMAANSCNFTEHKVLSLQDRSLFAPYCFTDWPPVGDGNDKVSDISYATAYTFEDCVQKCVDYNKDLKTGKKCAALSYVANLTDSFEVKHLGGNCWLKDKRGKNEGGGSGEVASAALVGST